MSVGVIIGSTGVGDGELYSTKTEYPQESPWIDLWATGQDKEAKIGPALAKLKNRIIGSNRQKTLALSEGILPQVLSLLCDVSLPSGIRQDACIILGSLVKGTSDNVRSVVNANSIPSLISVLESSDGDLISYALSCLTTIFSHEFSPTEVLFSTPGLLPHLLVLMNESTRNQISVATILSHSCKTRQAQGILAELGVVVNLAPLLCSPSCKVNLPAVKSLSALAHKNESVSGQIARTRWEDELVPDLLLSLMARDRPVELQLEVARALTYLHRSSALRWDEPKVINRTLPTLVRLCAKEHSEGIRAGAAQTLAYLIEVEKELQRIAADSNHLIPTLADFIKSPHSTLFKPVTGSPSPNMLQAALRAFGALGANDEGIRKRIIEREGLMDRLMSGLDDPDESVLLGSLHCLHSLSRSVHLLRTTFKDHLVWKPLTKLLLQNSNPEVLNVVTSTSCNLILEFSPAKDHMRSEGAIDKFCQLTRHADSSLRINGIWGLMNVAFQSDEGVKTEILKSLRDVGTDQLFRLLSDSEVMVVLKTLGLLRNLLSTPKHIDRIMDSYGTEIMQATILTLESDYGPEVKEQALCVLTNIADGVTSKEFIMRNEDVLKKIANYLSGNGNPKLQMAAVLCVTNLALKEAEGSAERQSKLKGMGIFELMHGFITDGDQALFDKVKTALNQFK